MIKKNEARVNLESLPALENFIAVLDQVKAIDIKVFDLNGISYCFDHVIIASGSSTTHVRGICDKVIHNISKKAVNVEGISDNNWVLLDYGTIIIHIFLDETRFEFQLEDLYQEWIDKNIAQAS